MTTTQWTSRLPTLDKLGITAPTDIDHGTIAKQWFERFCSKITANDVEGVLDLICEDGLWRDVLALTWDIRTFDGAPKIRPFLVNRLEAKMRNFKLKGPPALQKPFPDLIWIIATFEFDTQVGPCTGVFRLVPTVNGEWKAYTIFTNLEDLKDFPEKIGPLRRREVLSSGVWAEARRKETEFADQNPSVLIVGGGQSALSLAARLKYLHVSTLVIEKDAHVGDSWRKRYDSLCLHFPICKSANTEL
jgi:hypothetical protein